MPDGKMLAAADALRNYPWDVAAGRLTATIAPPAGSSSGN